MRAAQKGSAEAMHFLGYNYEKGFGFDIDFESALYWYQ
jgi:TPR repeat protein